MAGAFNRSESVGQDLDDIFALVAEDNGLGVAVAQLERLENRWTGSRRFLDWVVCSATWVKIHSLCRFGRG